MFGRLLSGQKLAERSFSLRQLQMQDPATNLGLEEGLFSGYDPALSKQEILLLYVNSPAVVIGKHQNPWKECDLIWLWEHGMPLLRRISGGGTVFHDTGNILWSFIGPKAGFSQEENLCIIRDAAALYSGLPVENFHFTPKGDIFYSGLKISGNALAFRGSRVLHHGTLLIDADLAALKSSLRGLHHYHDLRFTGPAVDSHPAPTAQLSSFASLPGSASPDTMMAGFLSALKTTLAEKACTAREEPSPTTPAAAAISRHQSVEWQMRRTSPFQILPKNAPPITVNSGIARPNGKNPEPADPDALDICTIQGLRALRARLSEKYLSN